MNPTLHFPRTIQFMLTALWSSTLVTSRTQHCCSNGTCTAICRSGMNKLCNKYVHTSVEAEL